MFVTVFQLQLKCRKFCLAVFAEQIWYITNQFLEYSLSFFILASVSEVDHGGWIVFFRVKDEPHKTMSLNTVGVGWVEVVFLARLSQL